MFMRLLILPFTPRMIALTLSFVGLAGSIYAAHGDWLGPLLLPMLVSGALCTLGARDLLQRQHSILRSYPISAHLRFLLEGIRPELRQYFFEDDKDGRPFSRDQRAVIYQRAKMNIDKRPFGTVHDVYEEGYEWLRHSMMARPVSHEHFRIRVGGAACVKPYNISVLNISAMSFGALSRNAIRALNGGAKKGGFAHDTGEGGLSPYHRRNGRRHHLGDRLGLFRLPHAGRHVRSRKIRRRRRQRSNQDDRSQDEPGREARTWGRAPGCESQRRKSPRFAASREGWTACRRRRIRPFRRRSS